MCKFTMDNKKIPCRREEGDDSMNDERIRIQELRENMKRSLISLRCGKANDARIYLEQGLDWLAADESAEQASSLGIVSGSIADEVVTDGNGCPWYIQR